MATKQFSTHQSILTSGDAMWRLDHFNHQNPACLAALHDFVKAYPHERYTLTFYDETVQLANEVYTTLDDMVDMIKFVCEHENNITFIREHAQEQRYIVGMKFSDIHDRAMSECLFHAPLTWLQ